jgi:type II secretory pathway component PulF
MLLWSLAVAAERRLPLIPEFDDFALVNGGAWRSRAREVSERLRAGESLAGALDRVPGLLPRFVTLSIQVGEETGSLPRALREAALTYTARQQRENGATSWSMFWILMSYLLVVGGATVSFILYFIVPKFKVIFQDFGAELPPVTLAAIRLSESVPLLVIPFGGLTALFAAYLIGLVRGWEELDIPGVDRLFPHINGPPILRNLATVIEAGRPMAAGVAALADGYPRRSVRRRLVRVLETVEAGGDCWQALRKVRLLRPRDVALLNAAERVGNLPWALRTLADSIQRRRWNRLLVWTELAQPALIVLVGLFVFFIVTAFFYPTVSLLKTMESQIG